MDGITNVNLYFAAHGERRKLKLDKPKTSPLPASREKREINTAPTNSRLDSKPCMKGFSSVSAQLRRRGPLMALLASILHRHF